MQSDTGSYISVKYVKSTQLNMSSLPRTQYYTCLAHTLPRAKVVHILTHSRNAIRVGKGIQQHPLPFCRHNPSSH